MPISQIKLIITYMTDGLRSMMSIAIMDSDGISFMYTGLKTIYIIVNASFWINSFGK